MADSAKKVTQAIVEEAFKEAEVFFHIVIALGLTEGRRGIHVVFLSGEHRVEYVYGEPDYSQHNYEAIAGSKALESYEAKLPTDQIPLSDREPGATIYYGSIWNGLYHYAIAGSGFQAYFDRLLCQIIDALIINKLGDLTDLGEPAHGVVIDGDFLAAA